MKQRRSLVTLALIALVLAACALPVSPPPTTVGVGVPAADPTEAARPESTATGSATDSTTDPATVGTASTDACPQPAAGLALFVNAEHGYCVAYPETHEALQPNSHETVFVIGSLLNVEDPRLHISITLSGGRTAAEAADAWLVNLGDLLPQFNVERNDATLGGEAAVVLDHLPGQEINRRVFAVHGNLLYTLMFVPADNTLGAAYAGMEQFYQTVLDTFTFLPEATTTLATSVGGTAPVLVWEGYTEFSDGDATTCKSLLVTAEGNAAFGPCGVPGPAAPLGGTERAALDAFRGRLLPITYSGENFELDLVGSGAEASYAWQRAAATWALYTYAELASGRASAAARTALSWFLGESADDPALCRHLVVLNYGYAYARLDPCTGSGEGELVAEGWLETPELEPFDTWLYAYAPQFEEMNTFDGRGEQAMGDAEVDALAQWAEDVYSRLTE